MIKKINLNNEIETFNKNGFVIFDKFLLEENIEILKNRFDDLFDGKFENTIEPDEWNWKKNLSDPRATRQICNVWKSDNLIRKIVCNETIGLIASKLMGWKGARLVQDNILWKPSGGKTLGYHQDASYVDWIVPQTMISCWMSLDKTSQKIGTLEFVAGSHKWKLSPPSVSFHSPDDYRRELINFAKINNKELNITYVEVPAGGASFHHGYTWHGSGINKTNLNRRAIVSHCIPSDAKFHSTNIGGTGKIYKRYKKINTNEMDESFFPILWNLEGYQTFN